jgi:hypothetical protein
MHPDHPSTLDVGATDGRSGPAVNKTLSIPKNPIGKSDKPIHGSMVGNGSF